jgi:hypothetical protein
MRGPWPTGDAAALAATTPATTETTKNFLTIPPSR